MLADSEPTPAPIAPPLVPLSAAVLGEVEVAIDEALAGSSVSGHTLSARVVEAGTGVVLFQRDPHLPQKPASNTKLFTTAAAFGLLGPDHRFETDVWADGPLDGGGAVANLRIVGEHDPTWSDWFYDSADTVPDFIADALWAQGLRGVTGSVEVCGEYVYDGYNFGYLDVAAQRSAAAAALISAFEARGISVAPSTAELCSDFEAPAGWTLMTTWRSQPLSVIAWPINAISHNEFADNLLRAVGHATGAASTYWSGAQAAIAWLASVGLDTTGIAFNDGSGLSHDNRFTAAQVVALFEAAALQPWGELWLESLSVAGVDGTLASRMTGEETSGRVFGKSGTLNGVITTSGQLVNRYDGRRYWFSFLMNEVVDQSAARSVHNQAVEGFAWALRATERPDAPRLESVVRVAAGLAEVSWDAEKGADGFRVWWSADGRAWNEADSVYTLGQSATLPVGTERVFVRVTALSAGGESDASDVYGVVAGEVAASVLLVDGHDRWEVQPVPENTLGEAHRFMVDTGEAVAGVSFDTVANEALVSGQVTLSDYSGAIWVLGEESTADETFSAAEQTLVQAWLEGGGQLLVSGAEIGWDLGEKGSAADQAFLGDVLRVAYLGDDAATYTVGGGSGPFEGLPPMGFYTPGRMDIAYPDQLGTSGGSTAVLNYLGGDGGVAATAFAGDGYRVVVMGFPLETIDNVADRRAVVDSVLGWFGQ